MRLLQDGCIDDLHLAIYRINEATVNALIEYIDSGKIAHATFLISNFFNQTKKPEKWAIKLADFCRNNSKTTFAYLHNHSKVCCVKNSKGHYVFEGSGNMSDNARIEQYTYACSKSLYDFHVGWMDDLMHKFGKII